MGDKMGENCQNCGEVLDDSLLSYCSSKCQFENYLNSQNSHLKK